MKFGLVTDFEFRGDTLIEDGVGGTYDTLPEVYAAAGELLEEGAGIIYICTCEYVPDKDWWRSIEQIGKVELEEEFWAEYTDYDKVDA